MRLANPLEAGRPSHLRALLNGLRAVSSHGDFGGWRYGGQGHRPATKTSRPELSALLLGSPSSS
jgi:hypothetical protein